MTTLWQDVRYGFRMLARDPGFTAVAVLSLSLGIGVTVAVFSVVNGVLLRPMHFKDVDRLIMIWEQEKKSGNLWTVSPANYLDWKSQNTVFEQMAIMGFRSTYPLLGTDEPARVDVESVSPEFFSVLGVQPLLGRTFTVAEARDGAPPVAVLSYGLWQRRYGADPGMVGRTVSLGGGPHTVVGVLPPEFQFHKGVELWLPYVTDRIESAKRGGWAANVVARLKPGVTRARAQAEMDVIAERLAQAYPQSNQGFGVRVTSLHEDLVQNVRLMLYVFQGAVLLVFLMATANVASLLLARSTSRGREMALRAALGAGRWRIVRQLLCESLLLGLAGGALGLLAAYWGLAGFGYWAAGFLPRMEEIRVDGRVLGFALVVSVASGLLFGLAPALQALRVDLNACFKESAMAGRLVSFRRRPLGWWLVIGEISLSGVLLVGAGLLLKSFLLLSQVQPGLDPRNVLTVALGPTGQRLSPELLDRLSSVPGVQAVGAVCYMPISDGAFIRGDSPTVEGEVPCAPGEERRIYYNSVTPGYLRAMGIPLLQGRDIAVEDTEQALPVAVVNETFVKRLLGGADPIGRRLTFGRRHTIVGVVADVKLGGLDKETPPQVYHAYLQEQRILPATHLVLRTTSDPMSLAASIRQLVQSVEKDRPILSVGTMQERIDKSMLPQRLRTRLLALFAAAGLLLAMVGVYGMVSYSVAQRVREFGIRRSLGAREEAIIRLVMRQALWLIVGGLGLGLAGATAVTRLLKTFLFQVQPLDPVVVVGVPAFFAGQLPARPPGSQGRPDGGVAIRIGEIYDDAVARHPVWTANAHAVSGLHVGRGPDSDPGHRDQHGCVQLSGPCPVSTVAGAEAAGIGGRGIPVRPGREPPEIRGFSLSPLRSLPR
jgi:putative ABC transport system permease protein